MVEVLDFLTNKVVIQENLPKIIGVTLNQEQPPQNFPH